MTWDDTLGNLRVLDKWRADAGLNYGIERPRGPAAHHPQPAAGEAGAAIPAQPVRGLPKSASRRRARLRGLPRLRQRRDPARRLLRAGRQRVRHRLGLRRRPDRALLGEWLRARGVRDDAVIIAKGAHSPPDLSRRDRPPADARASTGSAPTTSTSTSCTATTRTCRSASSSMRWTPRCRRAASAVRSAARTGRVSASTRRSTTPSAPAGRASAPSPTTSRSPK